MKKIKLLLLSTLIGVFSITITSCQKDIKADISDLQNEMVTVQSSITALNQATSAEYATN